MLRPHRSFVVAGLLAALAAVAAITGPSSCQDTDPSCRVKPTGSIFAYVLSRTDLMHYHATVRVLTVSSFDSTGTQRAVVRDTTGAEPDTLVYGAPPSAQAPPLPLQPGDLVDVTLDHVGGFPTVDGLLITDGIGLLFAAASDVGAGAHVLKDGLPGFTMAMLPPTCDSRPHNGCYDSIRNVPIHVTHGPDSVTLYQGESADLDPWVVHCFTSQVVDYNSNCLDAGLIALSYAIARRVPQVLPDAR